MDAVSERDMAGYLQVRLEAAAKEQTPNRQNTRDRTALLRAMLLVSNLSLVIIISYMGGNPCVTHCNRNLVSPPHNSKNLAEIGKKDRFAHFWRKRMWNRPISQTLASRKFGKFLTNRVWRDEILFNSLFFRMLNIKRSLSTLGFGLIWLRQR